MTQVCRTPLIAVLGDTLATRRSRRVASTLMGARLRRGPIDGAMSSPQSKTDPRGCHSDMEDTSFAMPLLIRSN